MKLQSIPHKPCPRNKRTSIITSLSLSSSILLWVCVLDLSCARARAESVVACSTASNVTNLVSIQTTLFDYCIVDPTCSALYYQLPVNNFTVFQFLTKAIIQQYGTLLQEPLFNFVCGNLTDAQILNNLWLLILYGGRQSQFICDSNEHLVVDTDNIDGSCECDPNSLCDSQQSAVIGWYVIFIEFVLIALGSFLAEIYQTSILVRSVRMRAAHLIKKVV